jgi:hypothetical protein
MARALTAAMIAALNENTVKPVLIVKIGTSGADVNVWSGIGDLTFQSEIYSGVGNFGGVSPVNETSDLRAAGLNFSLSGIPLSMISTALANIRYGRPAILWFGLVDITSGALVADPYKLFTGLTDVPSIDEGPDVPVVTISAENRLIDLDRARARRYTPEDQNIDYPTVAPGAIGVALASPAVAGNITNGAHRWLATFTSALGETGAGTASAEITVTDNSVNGKVELTAIPVGPLLTTSRKLYRTEAGGTVYKLLATIANNTTTIYTDNIADGSLGAVAPSTNTAIDRGFDYVASLQDVELLWI